MTPSHRLAAAAALAMLLSALVSPSEARPTTLAASEPPSVQKEVAPETLLDKGMPASEVLRRMGPPNQVKPMASPNGKAEVWIYRTMIGDVAELVTVGSKPVTVSRVGPDNRVYMQTISEEPIYKMQRKIRERVVSLLIFNDHFIVQKVVVEERRRYE